jgi:hypothetical protein
VSGRSRELARNGRPTETEPSVMRPYQHMAGPAREAWLAIAPKLVARSLLTEETRLGLMLFCQAYATHRRLRVIERRCSHERDRQCVAIHTEQWRLMARKYAAGFELIRVVRIPLAPLDADGEDAELRAWFTAGRDCAKEGARRRRSRPLPRGGLP